MYILFWFFAIAAGVALGVALACLWIARDFLFDPNRNKRKGHVFLSFHGADHAFAKQIAATLEQHGISCCRYEPDSFANAPLTDREAGNYSELDEYWAAIRRDPRSTAVFYYRNFVRSSCLLVLIPRRLEENSRFVQAEIDIANSLHLTIYQVDAPEQLSTYLPQISEERIPWENQPYSQLLLNKLRNHLEELYFEDPALNSSEAYPEIQALYDRGGFMDFDSALDPVGLQILSGCFSFLLLLFCLLCALIALFIHWHWL